MENKARICDICDPSILICDAKNYCIECSRYMCNKCLTIHNRIESNINHTVHSKNNINNKIFKSYDPKCKRHDQDLRIYCNECEELICPICCAMSHFNHNKDGNIKQHSEVSKQILQRKVDNIDQIIMSQRTIKDENNKIRTKFLITVKQIQDDINSQTINLKEIMEKKSKELIDKLMGVKDNLVKLNKMPKEISDYILSLNNQKLILKKIIEYGTNIDLIKLKMATSTRDAIDSKQPKLIQPERYIFMKPLEDVKSLATKDSFGSIQNIQIDGKIKLVKSASNSKSICAMKHHLFMLNYPSIHVYDMHLNNFKTSIVLKIERAKNTAASQIIGISNALFILSDMINTDGKKSIIYKFDLQNYICTKWKTMMMICRISSTNHATILATTGKRELIEFSLDGLQLKLIKYSVEAGLIPKNFFNTSYQLVDGRYVATLKDEQLSHLYLIDSDGDVIKSNSIKHSGYTTMCTDYNKYIFVSDHKRNIITLFSNELHKIREFHFTNVVQILYDCENKRLLVKTFNKILYFNHYEECIKDIYI